MSQNLNGIITWLKNWFYEKDEVDTALNNKQATLVSGTNIKTVNNTSLLGSGNITIGGGGVTVDSALDNTSTNPVENKVIKGALDDKVDKVPGKDLFSGDYTDLTNKPSYSATVTSSTTGSYKMGSINISGNDIDIYGKDTHQSLTPTRVYNCSSFNSTYINTSSTNNLSLYKLGDLYFLRYLISTKTLTYASTDYTINSDNIPSDYRPGNDKTFYVATSKGVNGRIIVKSNGKVTIGASSDSQIIYVSGTLIWGW